MKQEIIIYSKCKELHKKDLIVGKYGKDRLGVGVICLPFKTKKHKRR